MQESNYSRNSSGICRSRKKQRSRQQQEAEAIDALKTKFMLQAEKKCRKIYAGQVEYSLKLGLEVKRIDFWECAIRRKRKVKVSPRMWARKKKAAEIKGPTGHLTEDEMHAKLREAQKKYREIKKNDKEERASFLDTLPPKV